MKRLEDNRKAKRYPMHWKVAIVYDHTDEHPTYHGVTHDISIGGLSLLTDHNIHTEESITLLLAIPPRQRGERTKIVEIRARMAYTVLSAGHDQFRIGMNFESFKGQGHKLLDNTLKERAIVYTTDHNR